MAKAIKIQWELKNGKTVTVTTFHGEDKLQVHVTGKGRFWGKLTKCTKNNTVSKIGPLGIFKPEHDRILAAMAARTASTHGTATAPKKTINNPCPKCGSYCYGDCEAI